jgi:hypothetical protein
MHVVEVSLILNSPVGYLYGIVRARTSSGVHLTVVDLCQSDSDCHANAKCREDDGAAFKRCICDRFYQGDGVRSCVPGRGTLLLVV